MAKAAAGQAGAERRSVRPEAIDTPPEGDSAMALAAPRFIASVAALSAATLIGHLMLAPSGAGGVLHMLIPALGLWLARPRDVVVLGGVGAGLVVSGALLTPAPADPVAALTGSALALLAVATATWLVYMARRKPARLSRGSKREPLPQAAPVVPPPGIDDATPTAQVRHEVRTPLNAIIGFSEIARREFFGPLGNERYRNYMDDINAAAYQLLDVVERRLEGRNDVTAAGSRRPPSGSGAVDAPPCLPDAMPARRSAAR